MNNEYTNDIQQAYRTCRIGQERREHSEDFMMPDYIPDIRRIAFSGVDARIEKRAVVSGRAEWECVLTYTAVLLGEDDTIRSVTLRSTLDGEVKVDGDTERLWLEVRVENPTMRALDPRRINGRCRICVSAYSRCAVTTSPELRGRDVSELCLEEKGETVNYSTVERMTVSDRRVSHDIELDPSMPEIADIVYCNIVPYITAAAIKDGQCELRGEAAADICCADNNGDYFTYNTKIPLSASFDIPYPQCRDGVVRATIGEVKAAARNNSYAENKIIELDFSWNADAAFTVGGECGIVNDIYSTAYDLNVREKNIDLDLCCGAFSGNFSQSGEADFADLMIDSFEKIVCYRPEVKISEVRKTDNQRLRFAGNIKIGVVYSTEGAKERYALCEMNIPFKYEKDICISGDDFECISEAYISSLRLRADQSKLRADCEVSISALVNEQFSKCGIVEMEIRGELDVNRAPITLCFNSSGDDLWNVAKRYNVSTSALLERNGIDEEDFTSHRVIVIPSPQKKREA